MIVLVNLGLDAFVDNAILVQRALITLYILDLTRGPEPRYMGSAWVELFGCKYTRWHINLLGRHNRRSKRSGSPVSAITLFLDIAHNLNDMENEFANFPQNFLVSQTEITE